MIGRVVARAEDAVAFRRPALHALAAARRGPYQHQAANKIGGRKGDFLRDKAADRKAEHVDFRQSERFDESDSVGAHFGERRRHLAGARGDAGIVEQRSLPGFWRNHRSPLDPNGPSWHEVRAMQAQGSGSIINISSTYGHEGAAGASIYVGAKHAVEGITKSVALEIAKSGIRVNAVAPGPTDTGMLTRFTGTMENSRLRKGCTAALAEPPNPRSRIRDLPYACDEGGIV